MAAVGLTKTRLQVKWIAKELIALDFGKDAEATAGGKKGKGKKKSKKQAKKDAERELAASFFS